MKITQEQATHYYDKFAKVYDLISSKRYYRKPRNFAIADLNLIQHQIVLNLPCGTGQNFEDFQEYLSNTWKIIGIDLSNGMLEKARGKIKKHKWENIQIIKEDATKIDTRWIKNEFGSDIKIDAVFCDLGLSGFPQWQAIIDNMISILRPKGQIVIMDWYIEKPTLRGKFIRWVGKGEVDRPIWQYLEEKVTNFKLDNSFKNGDVFVA